MSDIKTTENLHKESIRDLLNLIEWFMAHHQGLPPMQFTSIINRAQELLGRDEA